MLTGWCGGDGDVDWLIVESTGVGWGCVLNANWATGRVIGGVLNGVVNGGN